MTQDLGAWLGTSIMARRGVGGGRAGARHSLTVAAQGGFHYVYGPYAKPTLTIAPGDVVTSAVTHAAPHHLVADAPITAHRRWRGAGSGAETHAAANRRPQLLTITPRVAG